MFIMYQILKNTNSLAFWTAISIRKLWTKFGQTGGVQYMQRQPRPRVTSRPQDHCIVLTHLRNRFKRTTPTARATRGLHGRIISRHTTRNRLKEANLRARRPRRFLVLTQRHKRARLLRARRPYGLLWLIGLMCSLSSNLKCRMVVKECTDVAGKGTAPVV